MIRDLEENSLGEGVLQLVREVAVACVLTLGAAATLADVRAELAARGAVRAGSPFELRTAFPARTLADEGQTLAAAGLAPAATLCMRPLP